MFATQRRRAILDLVRVNGAASLRELAAAVNTSEVTVRRDVRALEREGLLDRRRGGVTWPGALSHEQTYQQKSRVAGAEKLAIARLAATLVHDGDAIVVGAGTTTEEFATCLIGRADLTVVTNSVLVAQTLAPSPSEVVLTGGSLRGSTFAMVGSAAEDAFAAVHVRYAFLSGNGLTVERGLSTPNMLMAGVDQAILRCAQKVVVLADRTKVGVDTMFQTVPAARIAHLVTDSGADPTVLSGLRDLGVQVHTAAVTAGLGPDRVI